MAKLPPLKRILTTVAPDWFLPILATINSFFQSVYGALNGQLNFQDNMRCQIIDTTHVGGSILQLATTLITPITGIVILQVSGAAITGGVSLVWQQIGQRITISQITGLTSGAEYKLRLLLV